MIEIQDLVARLETAVQKVESVSGQSGNSERYRRMLHTVAVTLEQTKSSFRSNRLRDLRKQVVETLERE